MATYGQRDIFRSSLDLEKLTTAFERLSREKALHSLVRWAVPASVLKAMLKEPLPRRVARELPPEAWAGIAVSLSRDVPAFAVVLGETLHERLGWDRDPLTVEELETLCRERPLEALWVGSLSENKAVRKAFPRLAAECLRVHRSSPACPPPSWEYVEALLQLEVAAERELERVQDDAERAQRERDAERQRLNELREELRRLRRENAELRGQKAEAERLARHLESRARSGGSNDAERRTEELERRLRKTEKEREHLWRELERLREGGSTAPGRGEREPASTATSTDDVSGEKHLEEDVAPPLSAEPGPRRRVVQQMLRKLLKKGKVGASHTHEDNVHRGVADHEKGTAKEAIELLVREGYLLLKGSGSERHLSVNPERLSEVRALVAGGTPHPRWASFFDEDGR